MTRPSCAPEADHTLSFSGISAAGAQNKHTSGKSHVIHIVPGRKHAIIEQSTEKKPSRKAGSWTGAFSCHFPLGQPVFVMRLIWWKLLHFSGVSVSLVLETSLVLILSKVGSLSVKVKLQETVENWPSFTGFRSPL